ncbi:MAG: hypothetical protein ABMA26_22805 [Limisphaerales bacterium]
MKSHRTATNAWKSSMRGILLASTLLGLACEFAITPRTAAAEPAKSAPAWIVSKEGAKIWNPNPKKDETVTWSGKTDSDGHAEGKGLVVWFVRNKPAQAVAEEFRRGRAIGISFVSFANGETGAVDNERSTPLVIELSRLSADEQQRNRIQESDPGWIVSKEGAKIWNPSPMKDETATWSGKIDPDGYAEGKGLVVWFIRDKPYQATAGELRRGRMVGISFAYFVDGKTGAIDRERSAPLAIALSRPSTDQSADEQRRRRTEEFCTTCANSRKVTCIHCSGLGYEGASWFDEKPTRRSCFFCRGTGYRDCSLCRYR